jgi:kynurenine 3-monooxygenase
MKDNTITVLGAGPVGSLLSIFLRKKGFEVSVFEKREDYRTTANYAGRSINIALSHRGFSALAQVGLEERVKSIALPMYGRLIHKQDGEEEFQSYSYFNDAIYSVSRSEVNALLIDEAEKLGVNFNFDQHCKRVDLKTNQIYFRNSNNDLTRVDNPKVCLGADGAFSALRNELIKFDRVDYSQQYLKHSYKELHIEPNIDGTWRLRNDVLHIWPRKSFMLIALPNRDGSFTCTLFLQTEGELSFQTLNNEKSIYDFFRTYFVDVLNLIPDLENQFLKNPVGSLVTIRCFPWYRRVGDSHYCILGDAAHAITPFYGQGMNCGFEDVSILNQILGSEQNSVIDWESCLQNFQKLRKANTDAIATMAYQNFLEMRDGVVHEDYLALLDFEKELHLHFPQFRNKYNRVSFSNEPYADILAFSEKYVAWFKANKKAAKSELLAAFEKEFIKN